VIYYLELGVEDSPIPDKRASGLAEAFWYCASAITFSQQNDLRSVGGRVFAWTFLFFLFLLTSFFTANLTANLTIQRISTSIDGPSDLISRPTAVWAGTSTESYLEAIKLEKLVPLPGYPEMIAAVRDGSVDAMVDDVTLLKYGLRDACDLTTTGKSFYAALWAWPVSPEFEFLEDLNRVLSAGWDSGYLTEELKTKWVGGDSNDCGDEEQTSDSLPIGDFAGVYIVLITATVVAVVGTAIQRHMNPPLPEHEDGSLPGTFSSPPSLSTSAAAASAAALKDFSDDDGEVVVMRRSRDGKFTVVDAGSAGGGLPSSTARHHATARGADAVHPAKLASLRPRAGAALEFDDFSSDRAHHEQQQYQQPRRDRGARVAHPDLSLGSGDDELSSQHRHRNHSHDRGDAGDGLRRHEWNL
jgi:hypothetical protein